MKEQEEIMEVKKKETENYGEIYHLDVLHLQGNFGSLKVG